MSEKKIDSDNPVLTFEGKKYLINELSNDIKESIKGLQIAETQLKMHEDTSALDADSESEVQEGLNRAMKDRTVVIIAHRLATTQEANKIVVFDKGEIIEIGRHVDLINKNGIYKELCEKQLIKKL